MAASTNRHAASNVVREGRKLPYISPVYCPACDRSGRTVVVALFDDARQLLVRKRLKSREPSDEEVGQMLRRLMKDGRGSSMSMNTRTYWLTWHQGSVRCRFDHELDVDLAAINRAAMARLPLFLKSAKR